MSGHCIQIDLLPTTSQVVNALQECLSAEEVDLRDVSYIARHDPVVLINIMLLVNRSIQKSNRPVINTASAAINLLGLPALKEALLAIKSVDDMELSKPQICLFNLIRNRIFIAALMTEFWAEYMGEKNIEEQYCASMFTGLNSLYRCVQEKKLETRLSAEDSYLDSSNNLKSLYLFDKETIAILPDSIQQVHANTSYTRRLSLTILSYELVAALELGYSSLEFQHKLGRLIECIDQSASRASYDFAIQVVQAERANPYAAWSHARYMVSTNIERVDPLVAYIRAPQKQAQCAGHR